MAIKFSKSFCRYCQHHRKKFVFVGVFFGGVYGIIKYTKYKIKEYMDIEQQINFEKMKIRRCFDQVQPHSFAVITVVLKKLMNRIKEETNCEVITEKLKSKCGNKIELWHQLKVMVFSQVITGICSVTLISLALQVQLNQVAGAIQQISDNDDSFVDSKQQSFLAALHDYFVENGVHDMAEAVKKVVDDQLCSMSLQAVYHHQDLQSKMQGVCSTLFQNSSQKLRVKLTEFIFTDAMLAEQQNVPDAECSIGAWLARTADILESPDSLAVFDACVTKGLFIIGTQLGISLSVHPTIEMSEVNLPPLAKLLPKLNSQLSYICSESFVREICNIPLLSMFLFNVFESCMVAMT